MPTSSTKKSSSRSGSSSASKRGKTSRSRASASRSTRNKSASKSASSSRSSARSRGGSASTSNRGKPRSQRRPAQTRGKAGASSRKGAKTSSRSQGKITIDHEEIQRWVESRGGLPATVIGTERNSEAAGLLRIDFPGFSGAGELEHLEWDEFFEKFEEARLAFLYDHKKGSKFNKFVARKGKRF